MREIKFRAWDEVHKSMFTFDVGDNFTLLLGNEKPMIQMYSNGGDFVDQWPQDVLMEYTGLKDSAGNEICEGDIVIINEDDDSWTDVVVRDKNWLELSTYHNHCVTNISLYEDHQSVRIIGNIYENPELARC